MRFRLLIVALLILCCSATVALAQKNETVTLRFVNGWGGARIPLVEKMIADFEAIYPWITVQNEVVTLGTVPEQLMLQVAGGTAPDVVMYDRADIPNFVHHNLVQPLDPYIERSQFDLSIFYEPEIRSAQFQGSTWSLPLPTAGAKQLTFYNIDLLEQAGLSEADFPRTWEELEAVARRLTRVDGEGRLTQLGFDPRVVPDAGWDYWLFTNGGELLQDERTVTVNTAAAVDTLGWIQAFVNEINRGVPAMSEFGNTGGTGFVNGRVAMYNAGSWQWFIHRDQNPALNQGLAMPPHGPNGRHLNLTDLGWGYGIPTGVAHPEESWLFIEYMTSHPDAACWFMQEQARPSPVIACNQDPVLFDENPYMPVIGEALVAGYSPIITPIHRQLFGRIRSVQTEVLNGASILGALEEAQRQAQIMLDEAWAERDR